MKKVLVFVLIICMAFIIAGAQEKVEPDKPIVPVAEEEPAKVITHLKVILID